MILPDCPLIMGWSNANFQGYAFSSTPTTPPPPVYTMKAVNLGLPF